MSLGVPVNWLVTPAIASVTPLLALLQVRKDFDLMTPTLAGSCDYSKMADGI